VLAKRLTVTDTCTTFFLKCHERKSYLLAAAVFSAPLWRGKFAGLGDEIIVLTARQKNVTMARKKFPGTPKASGIGHRW